MQVRRWWFTTLLAVAAAGCGAAAGEGDGRAPVVFMDNCGVCHGLNGEGKPEIAAPAIAGLPQWYVEAQLGKFRDGIRGAHADDAEGLRMRPMARTLEERDLQPIAAYVAGLPPVEPDTTSHGDAAKGKALFGTCAACHGQKGEGMQALNGPPIAQLDDWYAVTQIHKFQSGVRGTNPKDVTGAQMRPMANTLADDQAIHDVIAYLRSL